MAITLSSVIPSDFSQWYPPEALEKGQITYNGRPKFTQRDLIDWNINDLRSLLIVDELSASWGGVVPPLSEPGFRILHLPRDGTSHELASILASSDIYKEHDLDLKFRLQTALYTLESMRQNKSRPGDPLNKREWRNVIENYLLNVACEAQCRHDYRHACASLKKAKRSGQTEGRADGSNASTSPLLRQAIMANLSTSPNVPQYLRDRLLNVHKKKVSLTLQEKQRLWVQTQQLLYQRLGLDWQPDQFE